MHLGLIGYGNIARTLLELLAADPVDRITLLVRPGSADQAQTEVRTAIAARGVHVTADAEALREARPDIVVECAGHSAVRDLVPTCLAAGIATVIVSVGALAEDRLYERLSGVATSGGTHLILPSGAIGGIDLLAALAAAGDLRVTYRGTKPPQAWVGTPAEKILDLDGLTEPETFFSGSAREAAHTYPKNANVAATLALAGAGFDDTTVELVADPVATGNSHAYDVKSPLCRYSMTIANAASGGNAKTSVTTVYSVLREINRLRVPIVI